MIKPTNYQEAAVAYNALVGAKVVGVDAAGDEATAATPASTLAQFCGLPTFVPSHHPQLNDMWRGNVRNAAAFLREVADKLEAPYITD